MNKSPDKEHSLFPKGVQCCNNDWECSPLRGRDTYKFEAKEVIGDEDACIYRIEMQGDLGHAHNI